MLSRGTCHWMINWWRYRCIHVWKRRRSYRGVLPAKFCKQVIENGCCDRATNWRKISHDANVMRLRQSALSTKPTKFILAPVYVTCKPFDHIFPNKYVVQNGLWPGYKFWITKWIYIEVCLLENHFLWKILEFDIGFALFWLGKK